MERELKGMERTILISNDIRPFNFQAVKTAITSLQIPLTPKKIINFQLSINEMKLQGYIQSIGTPRDWETRDGEKRQTYPITITLPYVGSDGKEHSEEIVADHNCGNPDYLAKLKEAMEKHQKMEFSLGFQVKSWKDRLFNDVKLWNIQILL